MTNNTILAVNQKEIEKLQVCNAINTINKYRRLPEGPQEMFIHKYKKALSILKECKDEKIRSFSFEEARSFLLESREKLGVIRQSNKPVLEIASNLMLAGLDTLIPQDLPDKDKIEFIFDYVTNTVNYAEDYTDKILGCFDDFNLEINKAVPIPYSLEEILVTREAICDDISNLMIMLGNRYGVKIGKAFCRHNETKHAINYYTDDKGETTLIDATAVIRGQKTKNDALFASKSTLNTNDIYEFEKNKPYYEAVNSSIDLPVTCKFESIVKGLIEGQQSIVPEQEKISLSKIEKRI